MNPTPLDYALLATAQADRLRCEAGECVGCSGVYRVVDAQRSAQEQAVCLSARKCQVATALNSPNLARAGLPATWPPGRSLSTPFTRRFHLLRAEHSTPSDLMDEAARRLRLGDMVRYVYCPSFWRLDLSVERIWADLGAADFLAFDAWDVGAPPTWVYSVIAPLVAGRMQTGRTTVVRFCYPPMWRCAEEEALVRLWALLDARQDG